MKIEITLDATGDLRVTGDLGNKLIALGMLDVARHVVLTAEPQQRQEPGILLANGAMANRLGAVKKG